MCVTPPTVGSQGRTTSSRSSRHGSGAAGSPARSTTTAANPPIDTAVGEHGEVDAREVALRVDSTTNVHHVGRPVVVPPVLVPTHVLKPNGLAGQLRHQ